MSDDRYLRLLALSLLFCVLAVLVVVKPSHAASSCMVACKYRHPVRSWEVRHHVAACSASCRAKRAARGHRSSTPRRHTDGGLYPCVWRWSYSGRPYYNLHLADGRHTRGRLGYGPARMRRCLSKY